MPAPQSTLREIALSLAQLLAELRDIGGRLLRLGVTLLAVLNDLLRHLPQPGSAT